MDERRKKQIMIAVVIICVAVAIAITVKTNPGIVHRKAVAGPVQMLCTNPDCGASFEFSREEFRKEMSEMGPTGPMAPMGQMQAFTCPVCGEQTTYMAVKCKQCGAVFIRDYQVADDYSDRCPECGYSESEQRITERKKE